MDKNSISSRYSLALQLIREAGDFAHEYFRRRDSLTIKSKGLQDMASEADLNTEILIRDRVAAAFPQDAFLGEETGDTELTPGQGLWVVDPIDGTQPFISGLSGWCVSIAFVLENELKFGMVYAPARGELFAGGEGFPATLNGSPVERYAGRAITDGIVGVGYSPESRQTNSCRFLGGCSRREERSTAKARARSRFATWPAAVSLATSSPTSIRGIASGPLGSSAQQACTPTISSPTTDCMSAINSSREMLTSTLLLRKSTAPGGPKWPRSGPPATLSHGPERDWSHGLGFRTAVSLEPSPERR